MPFESAAEAEKFIFSSYLRVEQRLNGPDALNRQPALTRRLLDDLEQPDRHFTSVLVTGSKGKGSIAVLTAKLLQAMGYRVGLITSPHMVHFRERVRLDGQAISPAELVEYAGRLERPAAAIISGLTGKQYLSPTGLILALAALYFQENKVDFAVVEAGRGGRFDDCAVLDNPLALFGPVMLEHADKLGPTLEDIAAQKVALLKPGGVGLSVPQPPAVQTLMENFAHQVGAGWLEVGRDLQLLAPQTQDGWLRLGIKGRHHLFEHLELPVPALYEAENLAVALGALEVIREDRPLTPDQVDRLRQTLRGVRWPGRMHLLREQPWLLADCAVNGPSARIVLDSLGERGRRPCTVIAGVPSDRDWRGLLDALAPVCERLILTRADRNRLNFPVEAAGYARRLFGPAVPVEETANVGEALARLNRLPPPETTLLLGTQSVVAEALKAFNCPTDSL